MTTTEDKIRENLRHIVQFEAKPNPRAQDFRTVSRAFEKVAYPKIVQKLRDSDLIIKQKSLLAARELLTPSQGLVECIAAGITPAIVELLKDPDDTVRERAAGSLRYLAVKDLGCRDLVQHGGIAALVQVLDDPCVSVRDAAYDTLMEACRLECTKRAVVALETALPHVMEQVLKEEGERPLQGLRILYECTQVRHNAEAVAQLVDQAAAVPHLAHLLKAPSTPTIQRLAAQILGMLLAAREDARLIAVNVGAVPDLLTLLDPKDPDLATAASAALCSATIANEGKYACIAASGPAVLVPMLGSGHVALLVNVLQVIVNIAEAPEARPPFQALGTQSLLQSILETSSSELVKKSAAHALRRCNFQHWPFQQLPQSAQYQTTMAESLKSNSTMSASESGRIL